MNLNHYAEIKIIIKVPHDNQLDFGDRVYDLFHYIIEGSDAIEFEHYQRTRKEPDWDLIDGSTQHRLNEAERTIESLIADRKADQRLKD